MSERITISAKTGTKEELMREAHEAGLNLSKFILDKTKVTYISTHSSGHIKIGHSYNPFVRASAFGEILCIIPDKTAERFLLQNLDRVYGDYDTTELVSNSLDEILDLAEQQYDRIFIINGFKLDKKDAKYATHTIAFAMPTDMISKLDALVDKHKASRSILCRIALDMYISEMENVNPVEKKNAVFG